MQTLESLLQKLWDNSINQEELLRLHRLLERRGHKIDPGSKKDSSGCSPANELMNGKKSLEILQSIHSKISADKKDRAVIRRMHDHKIWWIAAACLVLVFSGAILYTRWSSDPMKVALAAPEMKRQHPVKLINNGNSIMEISLQDGSCVKLYPNSSITYLEAFSSIHRDITLSGKAYFTVAKNKSRPFTVTSGDIATTALGTAFLVNMRAGNEVSVKLFEGKVVIRPADSMNRFIKEHYLLPGQELTYEAAIKLLTVAAFKQEPKPGIRPKRPAPGKQETISSLNFNNEALKKVFDKLSTVYHTKISYQQTGIEGLFFTGTFTRSDNLENILTIICKLNKLDFIISDDGVAIKNPQ